MTQGRCVVCLVLLLAVWATGCGAVLAGDSDIRYEVSGTTDLLSITYETPSGRMVQTDTKPPWSFIFRADKGAWLFVSVQNYRETGSVTATIHRNGQVLQTATRSGPFVIVDVSDTNE